jgi:probable phosphoglycerate mutase
VSDVHCPARIIVARHGETGYESDLVDDGGGSLTTLGREQAASMARALSSERVAGIVCSSLSRAVQTAEIAASVLGVPVEVREQLHEFDVGDLRGLPFDRSVVGPPLTSWLAGDLAAVVPGGETGQQVVDRVLAVLDDVADRFRGETALVVSHGGVILALWGRIAPGSPLAPADDNDVPNCSTHVFERDADGWRVGSS